MMNLDELLNPKQKEAAMYLDSHLRIIAGAGSGKTRVLTYRIAYLIEEVGIEPRHILAITFTNKAANEMKERVIDLLGEYASGALLCTIHSLCVRILRQNIRVLNYPNHFVIMDEEDQKSLLKKIFKEKQIDPKTITVKTFSHYETRRFLWWSWQAAVYTKSKKTVYTYRKPKKGTVDSSTPPINWFGRDKKVARLHTHAAYDPKYASDIFSDYYDKAGNRRGDKINAINAGMPTYVATPLGTLRRFDPSDGSDIVLFDDIPFDPNHPLR